MRKTMLLVFLSYLCAGSMAQTENDYLPFLEEGKTWAVKYMIQENTDFYIRTYIIKGDTIIDGKQYKKLIEEDRGLYLYALREEGQKIYSVAAKDKYGNPNKEENLWYDFSVNVGDVIDAGTEWLYITGTDYVYVNGNMRKRIHIYCTRKIFPDEYNGSGVWIEGIGSDYGPTAPNAWARDGGRNYMEKCAVGGQTVFNYSDFTAPAWEGGNADMEPIHTDLFQPSGTVFDLQGRHLTEKPSQPGIYIQNGRKVVIK